MRNRTKKNNFNFLVLLFKEVCLSVCHEKSIMRRSINTTPLSVFVNMEELFIRFS